MPVKNRTRESDKRALFSGHMDKEGMDDLLDLYRDLFDLNEKNVSRVGRSRVLTAEEIQVRLQEGFALADLEDLLPDERELAISAADVVHILERHSEDSRSLKGDLAGLTEKPGQFLMLAKLYLTEGEEVLRKALLKIEGVNSEVLMFVLFNALKRTFLRAASMYGSVETKNRGRGSCPVCNGEPAVSYMIGEGGKRYLICFRCESHWRYRRLGCPFCGEEDTELSGYFYSDHEDYRNLSASVCGSCNSYIKVWRIEGDDPGDNPPQIMDLKTPGFDLLIEDKGYLRGAPNIYGIWIGSVAEEGDSAG